MSVQPRVAFGIDPRCAIWHSFCGDYGGAAAGGVARKIHKRILWETRFLKKAGFPFDQAHDKPHPSRLRCTSAATADRPAKTFTLEQ